MKKRASVVITIFLSLFVFLGQAWAEPMSCKKGAPGIGGLTLVSKDGNTAVYRLSSDPYQWKVEEIKEPIQVFASSKMLVAQTGDPEKDWKYDYSRFVYEQDGDNNVRTPKYGLKTEKVGDHEWEATMIYPETEYQVHNPRFWIEDAEGKPIWINLNSDECRDSVDGSPGYEIIVNMHSNVSLENSTKPVGADVPMSQ